MIIKSDSYKEMLLGEFEYTIQKFRESESLQDKLYFYSAFHGAINRIINFEFSETLLFLHNIFQLTNNAFLQRLNAIQNGEKTIKITEEMIEVMISLVEELCECIEQDKQIDNILLRMTKLSYITTGNGYYLFEKGVISIE